MLPLVGDLFESEEEVSHNLGVIETSNTFGKVLSPILGALLGAWIWYAPLLSIPALCLISLLLVIILVHEPKDREKAKPLREFVSSVKSVLKQKAAGCMPSFRSAASPCSCSLACCFTCPSSSRRNTA
ncbi:hypothetical protein HMSSN139_26900 [Paenibacillus sp. HMSSN-139]|nr:hypothetical protein HMSSN139_26900 [Paenibacillus sp. HMSSN-139]